MSIPIVNEVDNSNDGNDAYPYDFWYWFRSSFCNECPLEV